MLSAVVLTSFLVFGINNNGVNLTHIEKDGAAMMFMCTDKSPRKPYEQSYRTDDKRVILIRQKCQQL